MMKGEERANLVVLRNPRHEQFAQLIASGKTPAEAYAAVGYAPSGPRLFKNVQIAARVDELRQVVTQAGVRRAAIDRDWVLQGLKGIAVSGQSESARVRAFELCGKEMGMFVERSDNKHRVVTLDDIPADVLEAERESVGALIPPEVRALLEAAIEKRFGNAPNSR